MLFRLALWLTQRLCPHREQDRRVVSTQVIGVTLDWSARPTRAWQHNYECRLCGAKYHWRGIHSGDKRMNPSAYNDEGWPIDSDGNKLEIVDDNVQ